MKTGTTRRTKESGVPWIGTIPAHWVLKQLKYAATFQRGHDLPSDVREAGDVPVVTSAGITSTHSKACAVAPGIVTGRYGTIGKFHLVEQDFWPLNTTLYTVATHGNNVAFLRYLLSTLEPLFLLNAAKSAVPGVDRNDLHPIPVAVPPLSEQDTIADFLDSKTAQIDGVIAKKQRMIDLLHEKRQSLVSEAVTKGLDPDAPTKDTGIEWLGRVPRHWSVERLKYSITKIEQGWSPQCDNRPAEDDEWGVLKVGCGNGNEFDQTEQKALPLDVAPLPEYEIKSGDILMSRGNTRELVGAASLVKTVRPRLLLCDLLYRFHAQPRRANPEFLVFSLRSPHVRFQIEREAAGTSASMKKIGQETIRELLVCLPPLEEQQSIVVRLRPLLDRLDETVRRIESQITKLREYRQTLISAAVTGQIDVTTGDQQ